jgi:hypothetical protein
MNYPGIPSNKAGKTGKIIGKIAPGYNNNV